ncbi:MAG: mechanosensitive ion channel [Epsilonproteobacteria bacterium]|nr:mechanosensitive ion channel [Campylobacterota bacterium]
MRLKKQGPLIFAFCLFPIVTSLAMFPHEQTSNKKIAITILGGDVEVKKTQLKDLEENLSSLKKRSEESHKTNTTRLNYLNTELETVKGKLKTARSKELEFLNKKLSTLNDRKQTISDAQELWKEIIEKTENHTKLLKEFIEFLPAPKPRLQPAYSWKEFREQQARNAELAAKIEVAKNKKDLLRKKKIAEGESLLSWQKQLEGKQKEQEKLITQADKEETIRRADGATLIKLEGEVLSQEINYITEHIELTKLRAEKLEIETSLQETHVELEQHKLADQKQLLTQIESRLVFNFNDVQIAKADWSAQTQKSLAQKESINKQRAIKKSNKDKLSSEIDYLKEKLAEMKSGGRKDNVEYEVHKSLLRKVQAQYDLTSQELHVLDTKKDLVDAEATLKEIDYNMVDLRYKLKTDTENLDELLTTYKHKYDFASNTLKTLKDKKDSISSLAIETNRNLERLRQREEKLKNRIAMFQGKELILQQVLKNLNEAKKYLVANISLTQDYSTDNADLIGLQEKIVKQYNLIVSDLVSRKKTESIWRRSNKAMSLDALIKSALEAEIFAKKIFWQTPTSLSPVSIMRSLQELTLFDYLKMLLLLIFFLMLFIGARILLRYMQERSSEILVRYHNKTRFLYLTILFAVVDFALENYTLLFSWLFAFAHIAWDGKLLYAIFALQLDPYYVALFYLASIPILVYLSFRFLGALKALNNKLSDYFFAEHIQNKVMFFITTLCYASAILLPLRAAFLRYIPNPQSEFATVLLAAYSLVMVLILPLCFTKDEVLRLIPSNNGFLIWLKRKIETHYYPVFFFVLTLLVLINPYVGYINLAWFLAFAVPTSVLLIYAMFLLHASLRKYSLVMFMSEEDEEFIDKFEHAKAYYGFFIIFSFLLLAFATFVLLSRVWGFNYTAMDLWKSISEEWVIRVGVNKVGIVEFVLLVLFSASGFVLSSLMHRFVLNKLFTILHSEPGMQNTISRISHYAIVFIAVLLGLSAIHLEQFIFFFSATIAVGLGFALKDIGADWLCGFFVLIERPIEIGNFVKIGDVLGTVHKISARTTTIITPKNHSFILPNSDVVRKVVNNWGRGRFAVGFDMFVRVDMASNPHQVKQLIAETVQEHPLILKVPNTIIRLEEVEDDMQIFMVRAYISARRVKEQWEISSQLRMALIKLFAEKGIEFAKPVRLVYNRETSRPTPTAPPSADKSPDSSTTSPLGAAGSKPIEIKFDK